MLDFLHKNSWAILITCASLLVTAGTFWIDYKITSARHAAKGEAEKKLMRYEVRKMEAYEMSDPGSKYSPARQMLMQELKDDLKELEEIQ